MNSEEDEDKKKIIDLAAARAAKGAGGWEARLDRGGENRTILPTISNASVIIANDEKLSGLFAFNTFTLEYVVTRSPPSHEDLGVEISGPYPRSMQKADISLITSYMEHHWNNRFKKGTVEDAILAAAMRNKFHPILDWLNSLAWDGIKRLDKWIVNTFACEDTPYTNAVGSKLMIAAVRRLKVPGCKWDYMAIFDGKQGIGKSECFKRLFSDEWFTDRMPPDLAAKDAAISLVGVWCIEFAEIEHLIRSEPETIKAFLTCTTDWYRPPYEKANVRVPRQVIFVGTTNAEDYLRDTTGNRRIWPIHCHTADVEWICVNREQLWAEAVVREAQREKLWFDDDIQVQEAIAQQEDRMTDDVWITEISKFLDQQLSLMHHEVYVADILNYLQIPRERQGKAQEMRVANILRRIGYVRRVERSVAGSLVRKWVKEAAVKSGDIEF